MSQRHEIPATNEGRGAKPNSGSVQDTVTALVRPVLAQEGYDLILAEYQPGKRILRLYIDHEGGVGIDDCTQVSRWVSDLLDAEGLSERIDGTYNLEVSSPGLDRPLVRPRDFVRFVGREVRVTTRTSVLEGTNRRKFNGRLLEADAADDDATTTAGGIRLDVEDRVVAIRYDLIERARLVPDI